MFTGIVEELGTVVARSGGRLVVGCHTVTEDSSIGASVAVNGVCLTVVVNDGTSLAFDLSPETLARSTLGRLEEGSPVNLERPVTLATRLGGHIVQGHVDGVGTIARVEPNEGGAEITVEAPESVSRYLVDKLVVYLAPKLLGGTAAPGILGGQGAPSIGDALELDVAEVERIGRDVKVEAYVHRDR